MIAMLSGLVKVEGGLPDHAFVPGEAGHLQEADSGGKPVPEMPLRFCASVLGAQPLGQSEGVAGEFVKQETFLHDIDEERAAEREVAIDVLPAVHGQFDRRSQAAEDGMKATEMIARTFPELRVVGQAAIAYDHHDFVRGRKRGGAIRSHSGDLPGGPGSSPEAAPCCHGRERA